MSFRIRVATMTDVDAIQRLIAASVRGLQMEHPAAEREAALRTVFTADTRLIVDGTYHVAFAGDVFAGCGSWSILWDDLWRRLAGRIGG